MLERLNKCFSSKTNGKAYIEAFTPNKTDKMFYHACKASKYTYNLGVVWQSFSEDIITYDLYLRALSSLLKNDASTENTKVIKEKGFVKMSDDR